jgi:hypothetical protein
MNKTKAHPLADLPPIIVDGRTYLSYQAVTDKVAAFLFPSLPPDAIDEAGYRRILETAEALCRELGYTAVHHLAPPAVPLEQAGLYWLQAAAEIDDAADIADEAPLLTDVAAASPSDPRMAGLEEVCRQHFTIPVTLSDAVHDLIRQAVAQPRWGNDAKGILHDILGMAIIGGQDVSPTERHFTVIIRGVGQKRYWPMKLLFKQDGAGRPYLLVALAGEPVENVGGGLFELGRCVMTPGVEALGVDIRPYLARHVAGDDGELCAADKRTNRQAIKSGARILSAYDVPLDDGETARIWLITESDRSVTTALLPSEY